MSLSLAKLSIVTCERALVLSAGRRSIASNERTNELASDRRNNCAMIGRARRTGRLGNVCRPGPISFFASDCRSCC